MLIPNRQSQILLFIIIIILALFLQFWVLNIPPYIFLTIIAGLALFFIAFLKTNLALVILIFSMLLSPEFGMGGVPGRQVVLRLDDIFIFMLFFGWLARMAVDKEIGLIRLTPVNKPILWYIVICMISTTHGILIGTTQARTSIFYVLKYVEYFMVFFMVSNNIQDKKQVKVFVYLMCTVCLMVALFATKVAFVDGLRATAPFEGKEGEPNTLAGYLIIMIGMAMGILLYSRDIFPCAGWGGYIAFLIVPFVYTLSRAGWAGGIAMFVAFLVLSQRRKVLLFLILAAIMICAPVISHKLPERITARYESSFRGGDTLSLAGQEVTVDESASIRLRTWKNSLKLWSEHPILGRGVPGGGVISDVQYTRVLREVGLVGFFIFLWIIIILLRVGWRSYQNPLGDDFDKGISLGFLCSLVGLLVMGVAAEVFIIIRIMEPFWFLAAIIAILPEMGTTSENQAMAT
jgi:O-antigen ligase